MSNERVLLIDIETAPILARVWDLRDQTISISQVVEPTEMLCFTAKWLGAKRTIFCSEFYDGKEAMVAKAHELLDEADVVVHYNGRRFDIPHLNREFLTAGLRPPSPYQQVDLWQVVSRRFKFPSSKLAYVLKALNLSSKIESGGWPLWIACMEGDPKAWAKMRRYNRRDVTALEELYNVLLPWIPNHPSRVLEGQQACPRCGSGPLQRRGYATTSMGKYQRWQCQNCGAWSQDTHRESGAVIKGIAA